MASLQQTAGSIFPEGASKPKAIAKTGTAAQLTNELVVNAKEAIDDLWKARGYLKMKPKQRKEKLARLPARSGRGAGLPADERPAHAAALAGGGYSRDWQARRQPCRLHEAR